MSWPTPPGASSVRSRIELLVDGARSSTGLADFGGDTWREGLEVLVRSVEAEVSFNPFGEDAFYGMLSRLLANRLRIEDWYARHPEIDEQDVTIELLGLGLPRTGSTALAFMLAQDPSARCLTVWEASAPCPPPGVSAEADEERIAAAAAEIAAQDHMAPRLKSMLPQSATGPDEDHHLMGLEFKAQSFQAFVSIPTYSDWLLDCDMEPMYRYEKRALKLLQWRRPRQSWRLKSPTHMLFLADREKVFPETRFVMTHRDVASVLPSVADLYVEVRQMLTTNVDPVEAGRLNAHHWTVAMERLVAFRDAGRDHRFHDIGFTAFQRDPVAAVHGLYKWLGTPLSPDAEARMRAWWAANPRDQHGGHTYVASDFGLDPELMGRRFGFYRERFAPYLELT